MFEVLQYLEVILRNAVDRTLKPLDIPASVRITPSKGWWFNNPGIVTDKAIETVERTMAVMGRPVAATRGQVVAGLTFGFWEKLFAPPYVNVFAPAAVRFDAADHV